MSTRKERSRMNGAHTLFYLMSNQRQTDKFG